MGEDGWDHLIGVEPQTLIAQARQRAEELGLDASPNDRRNVINTLRHDYTGYDELVGKYRTERLYCEILDAIARDFPWLAGQCERDKATHFQGLDPGIQARRYAHQDAVVKQRAAREAVERLSVGDKVMVKWRGMREAEVVEIRRTRIKVAFDRNGSRHLIDRSADDVEPVPR